MSQLPGFFSSGSDVVDVSFSTNQASDIRVVISFISTKVLRMFLGRKGG
jgi:hypothetical protein